MKALAVVLAGVVALIFVLVLVDRPGRNAAYDIYEYNELYDDDIWFVSSLEGARVGEVIPFGSARWTVLDEDKDPPGALLLLLEDALYLWPEKIDEYLSESWVEDGVVHLCGMEFTLEEFERMRLSPEGSRLFLLSPEEMERYGIAPPEIWDEDFLPLRPAVWVNIR